jgi:hypothetical protein
LGTSAIGVSEGLKDYMRAGRLAWAEDRRAAIGVLVGGYLRDIREGYRERDILAIASTNIDARSINLSVKAALAEWRGTPPGRGLEIETENNDRQPTGRERFEIGDRIAFLRNENRGDLVRNAVGDEDPEVGVKNGERGVVADITAAGEIVVELDPAPGDDAGRLVIFDPAEYRAVALGWCVTGTKSQGESPLRSHTLIDQLATSEKMYVEATRAEEGAQFYADRVTFPDDAVLLRSVDRGFGKTMAADFIRDEAERPAFERVSAYVQARAAAAELFRRINAEAGRQEVWNHPHWQEYQALRQEIAEHAKVIAGDFPAHGRFVITMAKISRSAVEVDAGLRDRTLTVGEEKLLATMRQYAAAVTMTRNLWNEMKAEAGSTVAAKEHPAHGQFEAMRGRRDALAAEIVGDPRYRKFTRDVGVPSATVQLHAEAHVEREAYHARVATMTPAERRFAELAAEYHEARSEVNSLLGDIKKMENSKTAAEPAKASPTTETRSVEASIPRRSIESPFAEPDTLRELDAFAAAAGPAPEGLRRMHEVPRLAMALDREGREVFLHRHADRHLGVDGTRSRDDVRRPDVGAEAQEGKGRRIGHELRAQLQEAVRRQDAAAAKVLAAAVRRRRGLAAHGNT